MLQYNLRTLLLAMFVVCLATWVLAVVPGFFGGVILACGLLVVPAYVVSGIVYFRGYNQAFCIGAVPTQLIMLILVVPYLAGMPWRYPGRSVSVVEADLVMKAMLVGALVVIFVSGLIGVLVSYLARQGDGPTSVQPVRQPKKQFPGLPDPAPLPRVEPPATAGGADGH